MKFFLYLNKLKYFLFLILFYSLSLNFSLANQTFFGLPREQLPTESQKALFDSAYTYFLNGKTEECISEINKISQELPNNAEIYLLLGNLYGLKGNINLEVDSYKKAIELNKNLKIAYLQLANFYIKSNSYNYAITMLEDYLRVDDKDTDILNKLANIYGLIGKYNLAENTFKKVLSIDKNNIFAYKGLALVYSKNNDHQNAVNYYKIQLLDKKDPETLNNIGLSYVAMKNYKEAANYFNEALIKDPKNLEYLYNLALASTEANDYNKAIESINKFLSIDNNNDKAKSLLAYASEKIINAQKHKEQVSEYSANTNQAELKNNIKPVKVTDLITDCLLPDKNNPLSLYDKDLIVESDKDKIVLYKKDKQIEVKFDLNKLKTLTKTLSTVNKNNLPPVVTESNKSNIPTETPIKPETTNINISDNTIKPITTINHSTDTANNTNEPPKTSLEHEPKTMPDINDINQPITLEKPKDKSPLMSENPLEALDLESQQEAENTNYELRNPAIQDTYTNTQQSDKQELAITNNNSLQTKDNSEALERLSVEKPNNDKVQYSLAVNYCNIGEYEKALEAIKKAIQIDRGNRQYLIVLADIYTKSNDFKKAKSILYNLLKDPVESDEVYRQLGYVHYKLNELDEAQNAYRKAIKINPNNIMSRLLYALALEKSENYPEEIAEFNKILVIDPNNKTALKGLAGSYYSQQNYPEATSFYEKLVSAYPKDKESYLYLENIYMKQLKYDKAQEVMEKLVTEIPHEAEGYYYLGNIYARSGKIDQAIENYQKTVQIEPKNPLYHYFLGTAYVQKGMVNDAKNEADLLKNLDLNYATQLEKLIK